MQKEQYLRLSLGVLGAWGSGWVTWAVLGRLAAALLQAWQMMQRYWVVQMVACRVVRVRPLGGAGAESASLV